MAGEGRVQSGVSERKGFGWSERQTTKAKLKTLSNVQKTLRTNRPTSTFVNFSPALLFYQLKLY